MTAKLGSMVVKAASALGATLEAPALEAIATWLALLEVWNARMDLTAARSPEELVDLMVADALVLAPRLPPLGRCVDVGAGAGAPGLAMALVRPDVHMTLIEPRGKRASFLRAVAGETRRSDLAIERLRGESLPDHSWDVAVSRATLAPGAWLDLGSRLVMPGAVVWVLVANENPPTHARASLEADLSYTWPLTGAPRRALAYRVAPSSTGGA